MYYIGFDIAKENHYASIANSNGEVIQEAFLVKTLLMVLTSLWTNWKRKILVFLTV